MGSSLRDARPSGGQMSAPSPVLSLENINVKFGGIQAVCDLSLEAHAGQITGLIGPNGAGKTTTFNVITGLERPTSGDVWVSGERVTGLPPFRRARRGLARTFQRLEVFGTLTARENILTAAEFRKDWSRDGSDPQTVTDHLLERIGISHVAHERADSLPTGLSRLVELGRALAAQPTLLLLDEPGSGLDATESEVLGDLLLELAADGMAILLVEHDVELVMRVSRNLYVLDFGRLIAHGTPTDIQMNPAVQTAYLGAEVELHAEEIA